MLRVSISQIVRGEDGDSPQLLAQFRVDAEGIHAEAGERTDVVATIPVIDPDTGERLQSSEDPIRWARLLPSAMRSGDLAVVVEEEVALTEAEDNAREDPIAELVVEGSAAPAEYAH
jgi:hypothetical protein